MAPDPRTLALAALAAGLGAAPLLGPPVPLPLVCVAGLFAALATSMARRHRQAFLAALLASALTVGLAVGGARVAAIDGAALAGRPGASIHLTGHLTAPPRRSAEGARLVLQTPRGRVSVKVRKGPPLLAIGTRVSTSGRLSRPPPWERAVLRRKGVHLVLEAERLQRIPGRRPGLNGVLDGIRNRASAALGASLPEREAALMRGFVLGADDEIPRRTRDDFNRSGLAHLLAVSGQNVALLAALALPILAFLGLGLPARIWTLIALIALYVPLAGGGPSIQRAGVMGAATLVALLASRPAVRWHAVALAAAATLALNPLAAGDVGWQLSFAAIIGIAIWARHLRSAALALSGRGPIREALADGIAMTVAATLVTAPLMAHHFESLSLAALPANVAALPAVAPAMWLGMLVAAVSQLPGLPVEALSIPAGACAAYIAEIATFFSRPRWAVADLSLPGTGSVLTVYVVLVASAWLLIRAVARRQTSGGLPRAPRPALIAAIGAAVLAAAVFALAPTTPEAPLPRGAVARIETLDVGQGDAILVRTPKSRPILIDGGPPGGAVLGKLRRRGIERLGLALATHSDADHIGGIRELVGAVGIDRLALGAPDPPLEAAARTAGIPLTHLARGDVLRTGALRLEALWPPPDTGVPVAEGPGENAMSVVLLARAGPFRMLLTADAEAEATPLDTGPVDVLKVAHHGSRDAGLPSLLAETAPSFAVISVGEDNRFGHPTPQALGALAEAGVQVRRTDRDGTVAVDVSRSGYTVSE